jgi:hypothetical protein
MPDVTIKEEPQPDGEAIVPTVWAADEKKEKYTRDELGNYSFTEKQRIARELGYNIKWKTETELDRMLSGESISGGIRYNRVEAMGFTKEDLVALREGNEQIPQDTFVPEMDYDLWMKIIAQDPMAFNGIDLSDKTADTVHILEKDRDHVECVCGARFKIPEYDFNKNPVTSFPCPGVVETIRGLDRKPRDVRVCIERNRFRQFAIHKVPED